MTEVEYVLSRLEQAAAAFTLDADWHKARREPSTAKMPTSEAERVARAVAHSLEQMVGEMREWVEKQEAA